MVVRLDCGGSAGKGAQARMTRAELEAKVGGAPRRGEHRKGAR